MFCLLLNSIDISYDGRYQTAVNESGDNYIFISSDYGSTWTQKATAELSDLYDIAMSYDGKYQTIVSASEHAIIISSNYGLSWTIQYTCPAGSSCISVAMSSDGQYQIVLAENDKIYISDNYGLSWSPKETNRNWWAVAISSDGQYLSAVVMGGQIYVCNTISINLKSLPLLNGIALQKKSFIASNALILENTEIRTESGTTYVLKYEFQIGSPGTFRIKFDIKSEVYDEDVYGRIYINGIAVGTERYTTNQTFETFSENIAGINEGDKIQLYIKRGYQPNTCSAQNFRLYGMPLENYLFIKTL